MNILESIQASLTSVVGRCYPMTAPVKPITPFAIYSQVANSPEVTLTTEIPIENTHIQVDVFSKSYSEVQSQADAIRSAMIAIGGIPQSAMDIYESEVKLYRVTQDFSFWFKK